ncbi:MAG: hypothetical protein JWO90_278 [Solirubrobacterales bacterium]|jgi:hypothetical protein|nr:hypothetical protein [Solirubrobacterales bacterium]
MDKEQQEQFAEAVERKKAEAQEASETPEPHEAGPPGKVALDATGQGQPSLTRSGSQDQFSVRDKNAGHGGKTADKWNQ